MMFSYSLSFPFESFHRLYITEASTLAGLKVLGSLSRLTTDKRIVLKVEYFDCRDVMNCAEGPVSKRQNYFNSVLTKETCIIAVTSHDELTESQRKENQDVKLTVRLKIAPICPCGLFLYTATWGFSEND